MFMSGTVKYQAFSHKEVFHELRSISHPRAHQPSVPGLFSMASQTTACGPNETSHVLFAQG